MSADAPVPPARRGIGRLVVREIRAETETPGAFKLTEGPAARLLEETTTLAVSPIIAAGDALDKGLEEYAAALRTLNGNPDADAMRAEFEALVASWNYLARKSEAEAVA